MSRDDPDPQQAEIDRLTEELARTHFQLQLTRLVLARTCVDLATEVAKNRVQQQVIERLA